MHSRRVLFLSSEALFVFFLVLCLVICAPRQTLAADWTQRSIAGAAPFDRIAISDNGQYMLAADTTGDVYLSTDYGASWSDALSEAGNGWTGVAISDNGQYMAASQDDEGIWVSSDFGSTWDETFAQAEPWSGVTMTADGQHMAAVESSGDDGVYYSDAFGQINSWTEAGGVGLLAWTGISYAPDASLLMAAAQDDRSLADSSNLGADWSALFNAPNIGSYYGLALADDDIAALAGAGTISLSTDAGDTWESQSATTPTRWNTVAISHDGQTILAGGVDGELSLSTDGGATWQEQDTPGSDQWNSVSVSGNGTHLAAVGEGGAWTRDIPASSGSSPPTTAAPAGNGPIFSGPASALPGYVPPREQVDYPDGAVVYADAASTSPAAFATTPLSPIFTKDLGIGDTDPEVFLLQQYLNAHGALVASSGSGSAGQETDYFGFLTKAALARFQEAHAAQILAPLNLAAGTGYFGPTTRAFVNAALAAGKETVK